MAFENLKTEISMLLAQMQDPGEDKREILVRLHEKLNEIRAFGMPVPEDLAELERNLSRDLLDGAEEA